MRPPIVLSPSCLISFAPYRPKHSKKPKAKSRSADCSFVWALPFIDSRYSKLSERTLAIELQYQCDLSAQAIATAALGEPYRQIGDYVRQQPIAHADETLHFRGNECRWLWTLVTQNVGYFLTQVSRGKEAADTLLSDFSGYLVTYDYVGNNRVPEERRQ